MEKQKLDTCQKTLSEYKADVLILITPINRFWFTGIESSDGYVVVTKKASYLLVDDRYYNGIKDSKEVSVVKCNTVAEFLNFVKTLKPTPKKLLIENSITITELKTFIEPLEIKYEAIDLKKLRIVKTPTELKLLQKAADIAAETINYVKKVIKVGMTEKQVAKLIYIHMLELGASGLSFDSIVASGKNSAIPHHHPSDKKIAKNEFITVDIGCVYGGYCSDITRTFVIGKPTKRMEDMYNLVFKSQAAGVQKIKAGMKGSEVDAICRDIITADKNWGTMFTHSTGHGVGIEIHELPSNRKVYQTELPENSVVTVEPGVYEYGYYGVRIEDTVVVKNGKCVVLTKKANKDIVAKK
ncbi:MAG: aminopeptidase P family protein [Mycoplasmataceae bacterium]|nr:aminopeptidase P family protein [Mycoplasmataceae bacterium]